MGQKGSTLSARSQEFLVSLTKVSNQKIATSLICYQQKGSEEGNIVLHAVPGISLSSLMSHSHALLVESYESVAPAFPKEMSLWQTASAQQSLPEGKSRY